MPLYRPRARSVQAWQYNFNPLPPWALHCTEFHDDGLYLVRRSGKQRIEANEWLVRNLDGDPEWMTDEEFAKRFEEIA